MVALVALSVMGLSLIFDIYLIGAARRNERAHQREREMLINQIMHLAGKTWSPPPGLNNGPQETIEPLPQYDTGTSIFVDEETEEQ